MVETERVEMNSLKTDKMTRSEILTAIRNMKPSDFYVWDGVDEDDRPPSAEELKKALQKVREQRKAGKRGWMTHWKTGCARIQRLDL